MTAQAGRKEAPEIYLLKGEESYGPFPEDRIREMLSQGLLTSSDLCLLAGEDSPRPVGEVLGHGTKGYSAVGRAEAGHPVDGDYLVTPGNPDLPLAGALAGSDPGEPAKFQQARKSQDSVVEPPKGRLIYHGSPSFLSFPRSLFVGTLLLFVGIYYSAESSWFLLGGLVGFAAPYLYVLVIRACNVYIVTTARAEIIYGIISKSSSEVKIADIRAINVKTRGLVGLIGIGDVEFCSAGSEGVEVVFANIWKPHRVKTLVRKLQDGESQ